MKYKEKAVVLFSGGQDTTTCLALAKQKFKKVYALTFDYGQTKHGELEEIGQSRIIAELLEVEQKVILINSYQELIKSALTGSGGDPSSRHPTFKNKPFSIVPNRNMLFLTLGHSYCMTLGVETLIIGACANDYDNYYDCRLSILTKIIDLLNEQNDYDIALWAPLIYKGKAAIFHLAEQLGVLDIVLKYSHSCYRNSARKNEWGYGCGECAQCRNKKEGYKEFLKRGVL